MTHNGPSSADTVGPTAATVSTSVTVLLPASLSVNPSSTILAIAAMIADHLVGELP